MASFDKQIITNICLEIFKRIVALSLNLEAAGSNEIRICFRRSEIDGDSTVVNSLREVMDGGHNNGSGVKMPPVIFFGSLDRLINADNGIFPLLQVPMNEAFVIEYIGGTVVLDFMDHLHTFY